MGLFGGIGKALKGIDWGNAMAGLQSAGAIAQGDYGTAAQIQGLRRRERDEQSEAEAKRAAMQQAIQALVARGVPEQEARIIAQGGGADALLGQHNAPRQSQPYRVEDNAGNVHEMQPDGSFKPIFVDPNERSYFDPGQNRVVTVPNRLAGGGQAPQQSASGPQPGAVVDGFRFKGGNPNDRNSWEPIMSDQQGGAALNSSYQSRTITQEEANRIRQSLGPGGQAEFDKWLRDNNIRIGAR